MNDEQALLAQIISNPDDDTLRLVYADCLEERGKSQRAEFVRTQIELAKWPQRVVVEDEIVIEPRGPNYWTAVHPLFEVGARVDLLKPVTYRAKRMKPLYGLRVSKEFSPEEAEETDTVGEYDSVLIRDEQSVPEPAEVVRLRAREKEMLFADPLYEPSSGIPLKPEWVRRGFLERLELSAEQFLGVADKLIWHDGMTDKCLNCQKGRVCVNSDIYEGNDWEDCPMCGGKGTRPRPCPLTAHPIRTVKLTTEFTVEMARGLGVIPVINIIGAAGGYDPVMTLQNYFKIEFEVAEAMEQVPHSGVHVQ